jgi:3-oxoacyl-[acyl-carrier protein] reductase
MTTSNPIDSPHFFSPQMLSNKLVVVTGGSRGIGQQISFTLAEVGAKIIVLYSGNEAAAQKTMAHIETRGGHALSAVACDVSNTNQVLEVFKTIESTYGGVDILINNAGISKDGLFVRLKEDDWDSTLDVNLKGTFNCCRAVTPGMMKRRSGKIINISSVVGLLGNTGQAPYAASKSGLIGLTRSLAKEFATRNVQINAVLPGYIKTEMTDQLSDQTKENILKSIPMNAMGTVHDVAHLVAFLASPMANYITGQKFIVDGGMAMY